MRSLRYVGFVSSLLMSGVLGGLMAPLPSEAGTPTLSFQVDAGAITNVPLSTCAIPAGYTACFALRTGGTYSGAGPAGITRQFTIKNYLGTAPRLLVTDGSGLDNITLTTVEFAPVATTGWGSTAANIGVPGTTNYGEKHTLKIVVTHKFDKVANPKTVGTSARYQFALRTSGMFKGTPTGYTAITGATASGDFVKFEGNGIFGSTATTTRLLGPVPAGAPACNTFNSLASPLDVNYCPLKRTMGVTTALTSSFSTNPALQQVVTYPSYVCDNGTNCTPTVILTMTATVNGPDSFILSSSGDAAGGSCSLEAQGPPSSTAAIPCHDSKKGKKSLDSLISEYFATQARADAAAFAEAGAESTPACEGEECVCQDPDTCPTTGTIRIVKFTSSCSTCAAPPNGTFNFYIDDGEGPLPRRDAQIVISDGTGTGEVTISGVVPGFYNVIEVQPNAVPGWTPEFSSCGDSGVLVEEGVTATCTFGNTFDDGGYGGG